MSGHKHDRALFGALRGLLYMRIQELSTPKALLRSGIVFAVSFGLLMLLHKAPEGAHGPFRTIIGVTFALWFLPVFCLTKGGETLRSELKDGTIEYLWTRPTSKVELYFGFYLSSLMGILSVIGPALVGIGLAGWYLGVFDLLGLFSLCLTVLAVVVSFAAISSALSAFSSKFVVLGIFYFSFIEMGLGQIRNGVQSLAVTFHAKQLLGGMMDPGTPIDFGALGWVLGIGVVGLLIGSAIFSQSHYIAGSEKEA